MNCLHLVCTGATLRTGLLTLIARGESDCIAGDPEGLATAGPAVEALTARLAVAQSGPAPVTTLAESAASYAAASSSFVITDA